MWTSLLMAVLSGLLSAAWCHLITSGGVNPVLTPHTHAVNPGNVNQPGLQVPTQVEDQLSLAIQSGRDSTHTHAVNPVIQPGLQYPLNNGLQPGQQYPLNNGLQPGQQYPLNNGLQPGQQYPLNNGLQPGQQYPLNNVLQPGLQFPTQAVNPMNNQAVNGPGMWPRRRGEREGENEWRRLRNFGFRGRTPNGQTGPSMFGANGMNFPSMQGGVQVYPGVPGVMQVAPGLQGGAPTALGFQGDVGLPGGVRVGQGVPAGIPGSSVFQGQSPYSPNSQTFGTAFDFGVQNPFQWWARR